MAPSLLPRESVLLLRHYMTSRRMSKLSLSRCSGRPMHWLLQITAPLSWGGTLRLRKSCAKSHLAGHLTGLFRASNAWVWLVLFLVCFISSAYCLPLFVICVQFLLLICEFMRAILVVCLGFNFAQLDCCFDHDTRILTRIHVCIIGSQNRQVHAPSRKLICLLHGKS